MSRDTIHIGSVITNLGFGGSEKRVLSIAQNLDRSRFRSTVISIYAPDEGETQRIGSRFEEYREAGIRMINLGIPPRIRMLPSRHPRDLFRAGSAFGKIVYSLAQLLKQHQIDLVDAHHCSATLFGVTAARLAGRPSTLTEYFTDYWDRPGMRSLGRQMFRTTSAFITDSKAQSDAINLWLGRPHPRSVVVPNGIDVPRATRSAAELRQELGIPDHALIIGQVSRLIEYKGQEVLLKAAQEVLNQVPHAFFLIVGYAADPAYRDKLLSMAQALGIASRVRIVSYPGAVGDVWQLIDIHTHPSLQDSLPIAIAEGMALSKPAVVSNTGGTEELVLHNETGLIVPQGNVEALTLRLLELIHQPELRRRLGEAAHARYLQFYTPRAMAAGLEELFQSVVHDYPFHQGFTRRLFGRSASAESSV